MGNNKSVETRSLLYDLVCLVKSEISLVQEVVGRTSRGLYWNRAGWQVVWFSVSSSCEIVDIEKSFIRFFVREILVLVQIRNVAVKDAFTQLPKKRCEIQLCIHSVNCKRRKRVWIGRAPLYSKSGIYTRRQRG